MKIDIQSVFLLSSAIGILLLIFGVIASISYEKYFMNDKSKLNFRQQFFKDVFSFQGEIGRFKYAFLGFLFASFKFKLD